MAHASLREPRAAIEFYELALKIANDLHDRRTEGSILINLGNAYESVGTGSGVSGGVVVASTCRVENRVRRNQSTTCYNAPDKTSGAFCYDRA